jgi:hypothetical protein
MVSLLYGCGPIPNPEADFISFQERVGVLAAASPLTYCPLLKQMRPWLNVKELRKIFGRSVKRPFFFGTAPDAKLGEALHLAPERYGAGVGILDLTVTSQPSRALKNDFFPSFATEKLDLLKRVSLLIFPRRFLPGTSLCP